MAFDLSNYEDVATLNKWFQDNYPMGRIAMDIVSDDSKEERLIVLVSIYRDINDEHPAIQNIARGKQSEYNRNMARFYAEDVATSAIGRAILLLKGADKTAHKEGMERVADAQPNKWEQRVAEKIQVEKPSDPWTIETKEMPLPVDQALAELNDGIKPEEIPMCKHGAMKLKEGVGKTNKPYHGYVCVGYIATAGDSQCDAIWYELDKSGRWVPQKPKYENKELK